MNVHDLEAFAALEAFGALRQAAPTCASMANLRRPPNGWRAVWFWLVNEAWSTHGEVWQEYGSDDSIMLEDAYLQRRDVFDYVPRRTQVYRFDLRAMTQTNVTSSDRDRHNSRRIRRLLERTSEPRATTGAVAAGNDDAMDTTGAEAELTTSGATAGGSSVGDESST